MYRSYNIFRSHLGPLECAEVCTFRQRCLFRRFSEKPEQQKGDNGDNKTATREHGAKLEKIEAKIIRINEQIIEANGESGDEHSRSQSQAKQCEMAMETHFNFYKLYFDRKIR